MQDFFNKNIVLGISGGIAAYKSAFLVRELTRLGASVQVVMTSAAMAFITPMTLQALSGRAVRTDLFDAEAERAMGHIELAKWADLIVIAPATANCLAKLAHGMADDLLTTLCLATEAPVLVCPAMNQRMWTHPATRANCGVLATRGVMVVGPDEGSQACGDEGFGRMSEVDAILEALRLVDCHGLLHHQRVLITAGPTQECIDPVRYLTNRSSGKMGYALAKAAVMAGAQVILVSGPTSLSPPLGVMMHRVVSAEEMQTAVMQALQPGMIFIGAAAVADYGVSESLTHKLKKEKNTTWTPVFKRNPDILASVVASKRAVLVVGFAAETEHLIQNARKKLEAKQVDILIANEVGEGRGFEVDENEVTVLTRTGQIALGVTHKTRLAGELVAMIASTLTLSPHREVI